MRGGSSDSRRLSGSSLRDGTRSRVPRDAERAPGASRGDPEQLPDHRLAFDGFRAQLAIGFEDELDRLLKVSASLVQCAALAVRAREFLDEGDVALGHFL